MLVNAFLVCFFPCCLLPCYCKSVAASAVLAIILVAAGVVNVCSWLEFLLLFIATAAVVSDVFYCHVVVEDKVIDDVTVNVCRNVVVVVVVNNHATMSLCCCGGFISCQ